MAKSQLFLNPSVILRQTKYPEIQGHPKTFHMWQNIWMLYKQVGKNQPEIFNKLSVAKCRVSPTV